MIRIVPRLVVPVGLAVVLCVVALLTTAVAEEEGLPELRRSFADGAFVDEYFGVAYTAKDLREGYGFGGGKAHVLFSGKAAGGVSVRVLVAEHAEVASAAAWRDRFVAAFDEDEKTQTQVETGDVPHPWVRYVEESVASFLRHHARAFFVRGHQVFLVHARVNEKTEDSAAALDAVLFGLTVEADAEAFVQADIVAQKGGTDPREPLPLLEAGVQYMRLDPPLADFAVRVLERGLATAPEGLLSPQGAWLVTTSLGHAQLHLQRNEDAVATWKRAIDLAGALGEDAPDSQMNAHYNLACTYARLGRPDEAFAALQASYAIGPAEAVAGLREHAETDPDLEALRKDPRWTEVSAGSAPEEGDDD